MQYLCRMRCIERVFMMTESLWMALAAMSLFDQLMWYVDCVEFVSPNEFDEGEG